MRRLVLCCAFAACLFLPSTATAAPAKAFTGDCTTNVQWVQEKSLYWTDGVGDNFYISLSALRDVTFDDYCGKVSVYGSFAQHAPQCRIGYGMQLWDSVGGGETQYYSAPHNFTGCNAEGHILQSASINVAPGYVVQAYGYVGNAVWHAVPAWTAL